MKRYFNLTSKGYLVTANLEISDVNSDLISYPLSHLELDILALWAKDTNLHANNNRTCRDGKPGKFGFGHILTFPPGVGDICHPEG